MQQQRSSDMREAISGHNDVALGLARRVFSGVAKDSNLVFSPVSIHAVLSLIAAGSAGATKDQLLSFLRSKSSSRLDSFSSEILAHVFADGSRAGGPKLSFANGVWVDKSLSLKHSFKETVDNVYKAVTSQVDFKNKATEAVGQVNSWVEKKTEGLIKEVLPADSVDNSTRLIFANGLYFKGSWVEKFDPSTTKERDFYLLNGSPVQVPFMTSKVNQSVSTHDGFKVLGLPYSQGEDRRKFSMYMFLPDAKDGLQALAERLSSESGFLERHLPDRKVRVGDFRIPKFKISFDFEASEVLKSLGVELPFEEGGLTEMVESEEGRKLGVSAIFHKAFIEVNEQGTEAAAASGATLTMRSLQQPEDFVADHPFLYVVREDSTGIIMFMGHVLNPLATH